MSNRWQSLWRKNTIQADQATLGELIAMVGWKGEDGNDLPEAHWIDFVKFVIGTLNIRPNSRVLEVGCGPGGMLLPIQELGFRVSGVDYSESLIDICRQVMPSGNFHACEAVSLPYTDNYFDALICNSVVHYFPDLEYAERVIAEMARVLKPGASGAVLDINDLSKKEAFMQHRHDRFGGKEAHDRENEGLSQLFYSKQWVVEVGEKYGLAGTIADQCITWYRNSEFRFNYFFSKTKP